MADIRAVILHFYRLISPEPDSDRYCLQIYTPKWGCYALHIQTLEKGRKVTPAPATRSQTFGMI